MVIEVLFPKIYGNGKNRHTLIRACMNNHKYTYKWINNQKDIEKRRRINQMR